MAKPVIPYRNPNEFLKEFMSVEASSLLPKVLQSFDGGYPTENIFSLMRIEEFSKFIKFPISPARSSVYEFFWIRKGSLTQTHGLERYVVGPNTLCFYNRGNIKSTESCGEGTEGYYCIFDKEFILHFLKNQSSIDTLAIYQPDGNPLVRLSDQENETMENLLKNMEKEQVSNLGDKQRIIGLMLCQFLLQANRLAASATNTHHYSAAQNLCRNFIASLKLHALKERSVQYYAELLNVTSNHLNKCVKECTGKPVSAHIIDMIVLEAKVMLKQTSLTISEIAMQLGFENISYFTRAYKKQTGLTPSEYRLEIDRK